jgi:ketosteroid isomerase-like protein
MTDDSRLKRLEDLAEIHQLFIDYGAHLDAGDFDAYASLFASGGKLMLGPLGRAEGRAEIRALMQRVLAGGQGMAFHIISSPVVHLSGDTAQATVMWTVVGRGDDGQPRLTMVGKHHDELVREDGRWRFQVRRGQIDIPSRLPPSTPAPAQRG